MIIPAIFSFYGGDAEALDENLTKCPSLMFIMLPKVFESMPAGGFVFYLRFRPLDVPMYAFGTKNEDFRSKSSYPLSAFEGSSSFLNSNYPLENIDYCILIFTNTRILSFAYG